MNEPTRPNLDGLDIELARRIDAACRRFEADWRAGKRPAIGDYFNEVPEEGRIALRIELEALERELGQADETIDPSGPPTAPIPGLADPSVHEDATVAPRDQATIDLASSAPPQPDASGPAHIRYFGDYEIESELARGGMGVVFRARQISLNRPVALKMILAGQLANDTDVKRFYTEAEAAANLDHPGIVPIYEVGQHEGQHYFSMGFIDGQSLAQRLTEGPLPPREAAELMVKVAEAIEYAHRRGVIHRDLKPGNILLDKNGNPRVTDFGLAKKVEGDSALTASGQIMGTPSYMPPEQAGGNRGEVGPAADVYALGATLYALVTGRPPFQAATAVDTALQVIHDDPVSPRRLNPSVDRDIETIILKCLEKAPARRYGSVASLGEDLRRYRDGEPIVARPVTAAERLGKWARRRPAIASLSAAVLVVVILGLTGVLWQWRQAVHNLDEADRQRGIAQEKGREATEKARSLERQLYFNRINLAQREWTSNRSAAAEALLDRCPPDLRDWEWSYLRRLCHLDNLTIPGFAEVDGSVPPGPRDLSGLTFGSDRERSVQALRRIEEFRGMSGLAFSSDGRMLVSSDPEHRVKAWDAIRGDLRLTMNGHTDRVYAIAFSPDGRRLATGSRDTTIKLWDAATGALVRTLEPHGMWIRSLAFSPDGTRLVSGSGGDLFTPGRHGEIILWDVAAGREIRRFPGPHDRTYGVAFRSDGKQVASVNCESSVKLWDPETGAPERRLGAHTYYIECVAYSPDGRILATGSRDQTAILWDVATGTVLQTLRGHATPVVALAFSPDGRVLATTDTSSEIRIWDVARGFVTARFRNSSRVVALQFSPDGRFLATAGGTTWSSSGKPRPWARSSTAPWAGTAAGASGPSTPAMAGRWRRPDGAWSGSGTRPAGGTSATSRPGFPPASTAWPSGPTAGSSPRRRSGARRRSTSGTCPPAGGSSGWSDIRPRSRAWRSTPTAGPSPRPARTARSGSGTPRTAAPSRSLKGTRPRWSGSRSAPTAARSRRRGGTTPSGSGTSRPAARSAATRESPSSPPSRMTAAWRSARMAGSWRRREATVGSASGTRGRGPRS